MLEIILKQKFSNVCASGGSLIPISNTEPILRYFQIPIPILTSVLQILKNTDKNTKLSVFPPSVSLFS